MEQMRILEETINEFEKAIISFYIETKGDNYKFFSEYDQIEDIEHIKRHSAIIYYSKYRIIFRFNINNSFSQFKNIINVFIDFNGLLIPFHICITHYNIHTTDCFFIPCIANPHIMKSSIRILLNNIKKHIPIILERYDNSINEEYYKHVCLNMNLEEFHEREHESFLELLCLQEIDQAYIEFLLGNHEKALKLYTKKKNLTTYEYMLKDMLTQPYNHHFDKELISILQRYHNGVLKTDFKELICFFVSWFILMIPFGIFYTVLYSVFDFILCKDSFYVLKEDPFFLFLPSFISAIAISYFLRLYIYRLVYKKDYNSYKEIDYMVNNYKANRFMDKLLKTVIILSVISTFLLSTMNIVFYYDGFVERLALFDIVGTYYRYEDIKSLTYYKTQENAFGELIDEGTYVLELEDKIIDLYYYYFDENELNKNLISKLEDLGVDIVYKEHLPW